MKRISKKKKELHEIINKSRNLIKILLIILIVMALGVALLIINNTKILFNNVNKVEREKINTTINEYMVKRCEEENSDPYTKCLSSNKIYLVEKIIDSDLSLEKAYKGYEFYYYAYSWILEGSYGKKDNEIEEISGSSIPTKVMLGKKGDTYTVIKTDIPRDGSYYSEDLNKLFPSKVRKKMNNAQVDGTVMKLLEENKKKAEEYFK